MPAVVITQADLTPFAPDISAEKAAEMIVDAMAIAKLVAPCLSDDDLDADRAAAAKAVIRGAILRWNEAGTGAAVQQQALGFSQTLDTRQTRRSMFWPNEIADLQKICQQGSEDDGKAWSYDTISTSLMHAETCSANFGANYCDCGAVLTGSGPLWSPG